MDKSTNSTEQILQTPVTNNSTLTSSTKIQSDPEFAIKPLNESVVTQHPNLSLQSNKPFEGSNSIRNSSLNNTFNQNRPSSFKSNPQPTRTHVNGDDSDGESDDDSIINDKPRVLDSSYNYNNYSFNNSRDYSFSYGNNYNHYANDDNDISVVDDTLDIPPNIDKFDTTAASLSPIAKQYATILSHLFGVNPEQQLVADIDEKSITAKSLAAAAKSLHTGASIEVKTMRLETKLYEKVETYSKVLLHFPDETPPKIDVYYRNGDGKWSRKASGNPSCQSPVVTLKKIGQGKKDCKAEIVSVKWKKVEQQEKKNNNIFGALKSTKKVKQEHNDSKQKISPKPNYTSTFKTLNSLHNISTKSTEPPATTKPIKPLKASPQSKSRKPAHTQESKNANKSSRNFFSVPKLFKPKPDDPFETGSIKKTVKLEVEKLALQAGEQLEKKQYLEACSSYLRASYGDGKNGTKSLEVTEAMLKLAGSAAHAYLKDTRDADVPNRYSLLLGLEKMIKVHERFVELSCAKPKHEKYLYDIRKETIDLLNTWIADSKAEKPHDVYGILGEVSVKFAESCTLASPPAYKEALDALNATLHALEKASRQKLKEYADVLKSKAYVLRCENSETSASGSLEDQATAIYEQLGLDANGNKNDNRHDISRNTESPETLLPQQPSAPPISNIANNIVSNHTPDDPGDKSDNALVITIKNTGNQNGAT
jgi:hypothetical protein